MISNFTKEQQEYIRNNAQGKLVSELTRELNERFNTNFIDKQVSSFKRRNKIKSGVSTRFEKGMETHNKLPIGSEFTEPRGYTWVKVGEPSVWQHKQVYIYEQYYGKVPKGYAVIFLDQDKTNFDISNLALVEQRDLMVAKNKGLIYDDKEMTKAGLLSAQLSNKVYDKKCEIEKAESKYREVAYEIKRKERKELIKLMDRENRLHPKRSPNGSGRKYEFALHSRLKTSTWDDLKRIAEQEGLYANTLVREILEDFVELYDNKKRVSKY